MIALLEGGAAPDARVDPPDGASGGSDVAARSGEAALAWLPNTEAGNGATALHAAAENGRAETAKALLERGADPDGGFSLSGVSPLHLAAQYDRPDVAAVLLDGGAMCDAKAKSADGAPALCHAVPRICWSPRTIHVAGGATPRALDGISGRGDADGISSWRPRRRRDAPRVTNSSVGPDPKICRDVWLPPRFHAAGRGALATVRVLLKRGCDPDGAARASGAAPLHAAVTAGNRAIVEALLEAGADVERADDQRATPLHAAAAAGDLNTTKLVYTKRVRDARGPDGATPLLVAAQRGANRVAVFLLDRGADPNCTLASSGAAALHLAAAQGDDVLVKKLVEAGAAVDMRGGDELEEATPLYAACSVRNPGEGQFRAAVALLDAGADPNLGLGPPTSDTPLLAAVATGFTNAARALLSDEAEVPSRGPADADLGSKRSSVHQAPLLLAVVRGRAQIAAALLDAGANCGILVATAAGALPDNLLALARARRDHDTLQVLVGEGERCDVAYEEEGEDGGGEL